MTAIDTSTEAVERLARHIHATCGCALGQNAEQPIAKTLTSLLAERDDLRAKLDAAVAGLETIIACSTCGPSRATARATIAKIKGADHE